MDVAGARALAQRIAEGKPVDDTRSEPHPLDLPRLEAPPEEAPPELPEVDVVYFPPRTLLGKRRPWLYLRRPGGRQHRSP
jgi:hypothetical protein